MPVGFWVPVHQGATGEVLLAGMSTPALDRYVEGLQIDAEQTHELLKRVASARTEGWALGVERWMPGLSGIATGVFWQTEVVGSMTVSGPAARCDEAALRLHLPALLAAAIGDVASSGVKGLGYPDEHARHRGALGASVRRDVQRCCNQAGWSRWATESRRAAAAAR